MSKINNNDTKLFFKKFLAVHLKELIIGIVGVIAGLFLWFIFIPETVVIRGEVHQFYRNPQFIPRFWTVFILFSSVMVIVETLFSNSSLKKQSNVKSDIFSFLKELQLVLLLLLVMVYFVYFVPIIGFISTVSTGLIASLICFGFYKIKQIILLGTVAPIIMYLFFIKLLGVSF
ncbi:tripartite tricarboxylate transporter TctB family protein [Natranaerobius trueperi]|uniref:DUF1468 domain-containing protein n=1 Tax=Natranaerobius trueperi TaxID=759412 RepID=A0A226BW72_9FIRM|nr:tripartite tricarboxylate transporter TctB family protein [Natranaerobius trueperi]OWZ83215.1 hypothetical protein CDO51_09975 [Natranaerobius trueperi]